MSLLSYLRDGRTVFQKLFYEYFTNIGECRSSPMAWGGDRQMVQKGSKMILSSGIATVAIIGILLYLCIPPVLSDEEMQEVLYYLSVSEEEAQVMDGLFNNSEIYFDPDMQDEYISEWNHFMDMDHGVNSDYVKLNSRQRKYVRFRSSIGYFTRETE